MLRQALRQQLLSIASRVPHTKLEVMKFLCRDVIPIAEMEKIKRSLQLFAALEKRGEISNGKLDFLVSILRQVGLDSLAQELGEVGGPQPTIPTVERNGRLFTELLGRIAQNLTDGDVQQLSYVFSDDLAVPADTVFTAVQLFQLMTQRQLVTPTSVTHLCQELDHIGRCDMCDILHAYLQNTNQTNCGITHFRPRPEQIGLPSSMLSSVPGSTPSSVPGSTPPSVPGSVLSSVPGSILPGSTPSPFYGHFQAGVYDSSNPSVPHTPSYPNGIYYPSSSSYIPLSYPNGIYTPSYPSNAYCGPRGLSYQSGYPDNVQPPAPFPGPNDAPPPRPNNAPPPRPNGSDPPLMSRSGPSYNCVEESSTAVVPEKCVSTPLKSDDQYWLPVQKVPECQQLPDYMHTFQMLLEKKDQELQSLLRERSGDSQWAKPYQGMIKCDPDDLYPMSKDPHGICIIINNHKFYHSMDEQLSHPDRLGAEVDQANLIKLFEFLHYEVEVHENLSSERMIQLMLEVANRNHQPYDSFVCFIMSHGEDGIIHGADCSPVNLRDLSGIMKMCPPLMGKPKMFFIQACRGEEDGKAVSVDPEIQSDPANAAKRSTIPDDTDFFFGYATVSGKAAYRSRRHGSWFVTEICRLFFLHAYTHTLTDIMTKVNESISKAYTLNNDKQCTEMVVRLRKQIHFFCLLCADAPNI